MKSLPLVLAAGVLLGLTGIVCARCVRIWSYQELLDKSDLVVIGTATTTNNTKEHIQLPGFIGQLVLGVETKFAVSAVLKGNQGTNDLILHHYQADDAAVPNGPDFVSFDPAKKRTFLLFLVREPDGRYAPAVGQADPGLAIRVLEGL